jgi:hypothetical protein
MKQYMSGSDFDYVGEVRRRDAVKHKARGNG